MPDKTHGFDSHSADRIAQAVRRVESLRYGGAFNPGWRPSDGQQWIPWHNEGSTTCPPFGVVELSNLAAYSDQPQDFWFQGVEPTTTGVLSIGINGNESIAPGYWGVLTLDRNPIVAVSSDFDAGPQDYIYGPIKGSWLAGYSSGGSSNLAGLFRSNHLSDVDHAASVAPSSFHTKWMTRIDPYITAAGAGTAVETSGRVQVNWTNRYGFAVSPASTDYGVATIYPGNYLLDLDGTVVSNSTTRSTITVSLMRTGGGGTAIDSRDVTVYHSTADGATPIVHYAGFAMSAIQSLTIGEVLSVSVTAASTIAINNLAVRAKYIGRA